MLILAVMTPFCINVVTWVFRVDASYDQLSFKITAAAMNFHFLAMGQVQKLGNGTYIVFPEQLPAKTVVGGLYLTWVIPEA